MFNRFRNDDSLQDRRDDLFPFREPVIRRRRKPKGIEPPPLLRWEQVVRRSPPAAIADAPPAVEEVEEEFLRCEMLQMNEDASPLVARCPLEPSIRLMVDSDGRLHLWLSRMEQNVHRGIISLTHARFWACENIELIALTEPLCHFDVAAEPLLHLFTTNSRAAGALAGMLGPCLLIHLI